MTLRISCFFLCIFMSLSLPAAAQISAIPNDQFQGQQLIDFESTNAGSFPGLNIDGVLNLNGAGFAERFVGQSLTTGGVFFDVLSGTPDAPLTLQAGLPGQNLNVFQLSGNRLLAGLGPVGFPETRASGEGAVSVLFDRDQAEVSFVIIGGANGAVDVQFFRRDGSRIAALSVTDLGESQRLNFLRNGEINDIAGISLSPRDLSGVAFDNVRFGRRNDNGGGEEALFSDQFETR